MSYYNTQDTERRNYEDWQRYGRERGFFDRATDEIRSWFGDQQAESRRRRDSLAESRGARARRSVRPEWQGRKYAGSSPRGSSMNERGRYDEPYRESHSGSRQMGAYEYDDDMGRGQQFGRQWGYSEGNDWPQEETYGQPRSWGGLRQADDDYERRRLRQWFEDHSGRGPRSYQRADERILDDINERLTVNPDIDASNVDVASESGTVILRGTVDCRHSKRLAEDIAEGVYGVKEVHNELHIVRRNPGEQMQNQERGVLSR